MRGFDVNRFVRERGPDWQRLETMLVQIERSGMRGLSLGQARGFARLYRRVSSDLVHAQTAALNAAVLDYLNDIVARAFAVVHASSRPRAKPLRRFFLVEFPRRFRAEWRLIALAAVVLLAGAATGAVCVARDPYALGALIPDDHQHISPSERVRHEERGSGEMHGDSAAAFSGWLFTHNMEVSFLVFALGLTYGLGTLGLLFFNGVPLGALAVQYHQDGQGLFFWAWILPHGVTELTVVCIAGGAGFIVARGLWLPGRTTRTLSVATEAHTATTLLLGGLPLLALAGLIEGSISQLHAPALPYFAKLTFAVLLAIALFSFLLRAGREDDERG
jgi:uncharacterized membrane protein SpoIIM required for sporulation